MMAVGLNCLRSMTALVKWVVPIITASIAVTSTTFSHRSSASMIPDASLLVSAL